MILLECLNKHNKKVEWGDVMAMIREYLTPKEIYILSEDMPNGNVPFSYTLQAKYPIKKLALTLNPPIKKHHKYELSPAGTDILTFNRDVDLYRISLFCSNKKIDNQITWNNADYYTKYTYGNQNNMGTNSKEGGKSEIFNFHATATENAAKLYKNGAIIEAGYGMSGGSIVTDTITLSNLVFTIYVSDVPEKPVVTGTTPLSGFVRKTSAITFKWSIGYNEKMYSQFEQRSATFYYRNKNSSTWIEKQISGSTQETTLPAGTLATGEYVWKARIVADDGQIADTPEYTFTTIDAIPTVTGIAPINSVVNELIELSWNYSVATGTEQRAVGIQVSQNGTSWTTAFSYLATIEKKCVIKLSAGEWYWRIRGYNQDDVVGEWSEAYKFICIVPPSAPAITNIRSGGRPGFEWSSTDQVAYEYKLEGENYLFETGVIYGTEKNCLINDYIQNGIYKFSLRVFNVYGYSSNWVSIQYNQSISLTPIHVMFKTNDEGISLSWDHVGVYSFYYIVRNGVPVAKTYNLSYLDKYCDIRNEYVIRCVTSDDLFRDEKINVVYVPKKTQLIFESEVYDLSYRINEKRDISYNITPDVSSVNYLGRTKPVHKFGSYIKRSWVIICKAPDDIENLLGKIVFLRSSLRDRGFCVITGISNKRGYYGDDVSISFEETDYQERIEYDL